MTWAETELGKSSSHSICLKSSFITGTNTGNENIVFATVVEIRNNCTGIYFISYLFQNDVSRLTKQTNG